MPEPVRTRSEPYGKAFNTDAQQQECDQGTIMMARSCMMAEEVIKAPSTSGLSRPVTTENPPAIRRDRTHIGLAEMIEVLKLPKVRIANFDTCAYQWSTPKGKRFLKPQQFAGTLLALEKLSVQRSVKTDRMRTRSLKGAINANLIGTSCRRWPGAASVLEPGLRHASSVWRLDDLS